MLYCDHEPLAPFFTTGMSSPILDRWALELQQFNIKFQHIQGKKSMVDDAISQMKMLGLYQDNDNEDVPISTEDIVKNIIEDTPIAEVIQKTPAYNIEKLNLDILRKEQHRDWFCKNKVKEMKTKPDPNFLLQKHSILREAFKIKYTVVPNIVVPKFNQSHYIRGS